MGARCRIQLSTTQPRSERTCETRLSGARASLTVGQVFRPNQRTSTLEALLDEHVETSRMDDHRRFRQERYLDDLRLKGHSCCSGLNSERRYGLAPEPLRVVQGRHDPFVNACPLLERTECLIRIT